MDITVKGRHIELSQALRDYAENKVGRVDKILENMIRGVEVELHAEKNPSIENNQVAEVTIHTKGHVIRAREAATDMFAAIDLVSEKLETQARKYKGKVVDRHNGNGRSRIPSPTPVDEFGAPEPGIVKIKSVELKPMSAEEAILQMEMLGHDFFVFAPAESEGVNVLYRRRDGDYGLIEPRVG
ncbi:MAG: ribosomal subunit interface protein [Coriobacteriaceae bacterium]|nr:ribosomal subunit interface protein [Coriobacteriaceae bacterium]